MTAIAGSAGFAQELFAAVSVRFPEITSAPGANPAKRVLMMDASAAEPELLYAAIERQSRCCRSRNRDPTRSGRRSKGRSLPCCAHSWLINASRLDASVPQDGESNNDVIGTEMAERLRASASPLAHLTNAAGTPPHMGLGVDEDRWAGRVAIGNSICREAVDVVLSSWKAVHLTLPESKDRAGAREPDHPAGRPEGDDQCGPARRFSDASPWADRLANAQGLIAEARFAMDSPLEGGGFELSVPREIGFVSRLCRLSADLSCGELRAPISEAGCSTTDRPLHPV